MGGAKMSVLTGETEQVLKAVTRLAEGINKEVLHFRADRLDKLLNGQVIPRFGLHAALVGACIVLVEARSSLRLQLVFGVVAAGFAAAYFISTKWRSEGESGLPGECAAFVTATAACGSIGGLEAGVMIAIPYALIAVCVAYRKMDPKELVFAPVYSAIMLLLSETLRGEAPLLFFPVACVGVLALIKIGRAGTSFGLFAGMLGTLAWQLVDRRLDVATLAIVSGLNTLGLLVFVVRSVKPNNSDLRNFLNQGLAALTILGMIDLFAKEPRPYWAHWVWPVALGAFFGAVRALRGRGGLPTSIGWLCIAVLTAIWLDQNGFEIGSWNFRARLLSTVVISGALYIGARILQNRFVCDLARLMMLLAGVLCVALAYRVEKVLAGYLPFKGQRAMDGLSAILDWEAWVLVATVGLASLSTICVALSYGDPAVRRPIAWWHGLVRPRHAVLVRTTFRVSIKWFENVPVLGGALKALQAGGRSLRYLKTGAEAFRFADIAVLVSTVLLAISVTHLADPVLSWVDASNSTNRLSEYRSRLSHELQHWRWVSDTLAWTGCSVLLYGYGLARRQSLFVLAGTAFALVPFVQHLTTALPDQRGTMVLTAGLSIVFCGVMRWERPFGYAGAFVGILMTVVASAVVIETAPPAKSEITNCHESSAAYYLPKKLVRVTVRQPGGPEGSDLVLANTGLSLRYAADRTHRYCLDYLMVPTSGRGIAIQQDGMGLLSLVATDTSERTPHISQTLRDAAEQIVTTAAYPQRSDVAPSGETGTFEFDPFDESELARANTALSRYGLCVFIEGFRAADDQCSSHRHAVSANSRYVNFKNVPVAPTATHAGILYRPNLVYKLMVLRKVDPNREGPWSLFMTRRIEMPNVAPVLSIDIDRAIFMDRTTKLSFDHGVLINAAVRDNSESAGFVAIPMTVAHLAVSVPAQMLRFRINDNDQKRKLMRAQTQLLGALKRVSAGQW
jgi:hypothetical protein